MSSRFDHVAFLLRSRHAVLGAGVLSIRRQGSMRVLTSEIPGTKIRAMIRETPGRTIGGFVPKRPSLPDVNLDGVDGLVRFLFAWDSTLMRRGIGASFFPVAAIEFVSALVHDERRRDILSIREGSDAPAGFGMVPSPEWRPTPALMRLVADYCDDETAGACARQAAWDLSDYMAHGEDKPFDAAAWERLTAVRALRGACSSGREIPSATGTWREVLASGAVRCAASYMSSMAPNPKLAARAISSHLGAFMRHHQLGGCDLYILWNRDNLPVAITSVSADGGVLPLTTTALPGHVDRRDDVRLLLAAAGNGPAHS